MSDTTDNPRLGEPFAEALAYAARLHIRQTRKAKETPYIAHLLGVASLALDAGADEDEAIAAVLHDAVEDQGGEPTRVEIEKRFGAHVASLVVALSDSLVDTSDGANKEPWQVRKDRYIEHLRTAEPSVRLLAACDKLHNLRELVEDHRRLGDEVWEHFSAGPEKQLWFYRTVVGILADGKEGPLFGRLRAALADFESLVEGA
ncbi:MAG: HD domain-containing protein [Candidatus Binatia bacterium]|nr:HD domain-containing protein [Candidatus Binatia bacterium]